MDWMGKTLRGEHLIGENDMNLMKLVDSPEEAIQAIDDFYSRYLFKPNF